LEEDSQQIFQKALMSEDQLLMTFVDDSTDGKAA